MSDERRTDWQVQLLRLTLFTPRSLPGFETIWRDINGRDPDIDENRRRENVRRQSGPVGDRRLETVVTPGRTDVAMAAALQEAPPPTFFFGPAEAEFREF